MARSFWDWFLGRRAIGGAAPEPSIVEHDVLANLSIGSVDVRWTRAGVDVFGIRMGVDGAREFAAQVRSAADAVAGAREVDVAVEVEKS